MRIVVALLAATFRLTPALAEENTNGPTAEKARRHYEKTLQLLHGYKTKWALDEVKKADKEDGGHCLAGQNQMIKYGGEFGDRKAAEQAADEMSAQAQGPRDTALAHYQFAVVLMDEGLQKQKKELFARSHDEITKALAAAANSPARVLRGRQSARAVAARRRSQSQIRAVCENGDRGRRGPPARAALHRPCRAGPRPRTPIRRKLPQMNRLAVTVASLRLL